MQIKPHLFTLKPYPPGKTIEEIRKIFKIEGPIYKFNSNENPLGPSPKVIEVLQKSLTEIHRYPEASYQELKKALAEKWQISPSQVVLGNGSNEIIEFLFKALLTPESEIIVSEPSFLIYEKLAEIYGVKIKKIPLKKDFTHNFSEILKKISSQTKIIFLDHPHNPTGSTLIKKEWENFFNSLDSQVLVVIDEAYGEFIEDPEVPLGIEFLKANYPVLVLRTFSKAYGLAGLRLGYGLTFEKLAQALDKVRQPFNVNLLAVKAGLAVLKDEAYFEKSIQIVKEGRKYLKRELEKLGFKVFPSQANFLMVDFGEKAESIYQKLMEKGFLLRSLKAYGFSTFLRISIGLLEENELLILKLKEVLKEV